VAQLWSKNGAVKRAWDRTLPTNNGFSTFLKIHEASRAICVVISKAEPPLLHEIFISRVLQIQREGETETFHAPANHHYWKVVSVVWLTLNFVHRTWWVAWNSSGFNCQCVESQTRLFIAKSTKALSDKSSAQSCYENKRERQSRAHNFRQLALTKVPLMADLLSQEALVDFLLREMGVTDTSIKPGGTLPFRQRARQAARG
jgi:hypothetical protein